MKKLNMVGFLLMLVAVMLWASGCFTSAGAHTKKTIAADGTVVLESDVKIIGTGDKTSQLAADGLFADGSEEDLGAGVKKSSASQQSTGIGETLTGLARVLEVMDRIKSGGGAATPIVKPASTTSDTDTAIESTASEAAPVLGPIVEPTYSTEGYGGTPGASGEGVYGRPSCGRCRAFKAAHQDIALINLDEPANRTAMWAALRRLGFSGTSVQLPLSVTATGYTEAAK